MAENKGFLENFRRSRQRICTHCGTIDKPGSHAKGSLLVELVIWIVAILAAFTTLGLSILLALAYSIWRMSGYGAKKCPSYGQPGPIPLDSPRGRELAAKYEA